MIVSHSKPPNYDEIAAVFDIASKPILFCYGNTIFDPTKAGVPAQLMAHEVIHAGRQGATPEAWWRRYLADPEFRLAEEIPAHRAEYQYYIKSGKNRHMRRAYLGVVAKRLCSPLYGKLVSFDQALALVRSGE